jgi:hypothetical protein
VTHQPIDFENLNFNHGNQMMTRGDRRTWCWTKAGVPNGKTAAMRKAIAPVGGAGHEQVAAERASRGSDTTRQC